MNKVYIKRMTKQDITRSYSPCTEAVQDFFGIDLNMTEEYLNLNVCYHNDREFPPDITIHKGYQGEKDWRICGDSFKPLYAFRNAEEGDLSVWRKYRSNYFTIQIIKQEDVEYKSFSQLLNGTDNHLIISLDEEDKQKDVIQATSLTPPEQIVFYGVPGSGKSYKIEEVKTKGVADVQKQRVVFHPDYTNADFVGQIIPKISETVDKTGNKHSTIEYTFKPGPFTTILRRALRDKDKQYYLIIEEINRGNAAAIFGDLFQLLDRNEKTGWSCYPVNNDDVNFYIASKYEFYEEGYSDSHEYDVESVRTEDEKPFTRNTGLKLPPNLSIYATMNTNDQNVFTLDNAFNRRFKLEHIPNKINKSDDKHIAQHNLKIENTDVLWGNFRDAINNKIIESGLANAEDKQLGLFFIRTEKDESVIKQNDFANKVLKYLWHDVFKRDKEIFNQDNIKKFEDLIEYFTGNNAFTKCFDESFVKSINNELAKKIEGTNQPL